MLRLPRLPVCPSRSFPLSPLPGDLGVQQPCALDVQAAHYSWQWSHRLYECSAWAARSSHMSVYGICCWAAKPPAATRTLSRSCYVCLLVLYVTRNSAIIC